MQLTLSASALPDFFSATLNELLYPSKPLTALAVACSGGSDSRALLLLTLEWIKCRADSEPISIHALIIDHGLRDESADEAVQTAQWAKGHGVQPLVLTLNLERHGIAIQERARDARYEAMIAACKTIGAEYLLLGQHGDDQIETVMLRLLRGSGLHGLAGMSAKREQQGIQLLRPLLAIPKQTLQHYLTQHAEGWIEDPSNDNTQFARTQLRRWLSAHTSTAQRQRLWHLAQTCGRIRHQDETYLNAMLASFSSIDESGIARLSAQWLKLPPEQAQWMLRRLLISVNGNLFMPRQPDVIRLYEDIMAAPSKARSLHQCLLFWHKGQFILCREPARVASAIALAPYSRVRWDDRFEVQTQALPQGCTLAALGEQGLRKVKEHLRIQIPRRAALSLPALRHLEEVVYAPHIDYCASGEWKECIRLCYAPAKALAEKPFFLMNEAQQTA